MHTAKYRRLWRSLPWLAALLLLWTASSVFAQALEADPPGRVATLSYRQGGVVFAPAGEEEWTELPNNRPLTSGDRLWTNNDARAEVQLGAATLHVAGQSHLGVGTLDDRTAQFILLQGSVHARVRELSQAENFEIDTPNLAFRASQPGDYRIDVFADGRETRVVVLSGMATVFGEGGDALHLGALQQATFAGRFLAQVQGVPYESDGFGQWAGERNRAEDLSAAARHVPRGVVGYSQLDAHGTWGQDPTYGQVWYPQNIAPDWAPYRYGQWVWVNPWGWTWVDDAPWGFAPFHYGRWAQIGARWAWVPGRMVARPLYAPALVVFIGGGAQTRFTGWYPLGPGEAWYPAYRTTPHYVNHANFNINLNASPRNYDNHMYRYRPGAVTTVRVDDFRQRRPVRSESQPVLPRLRAAPPVDAQAPVPSRFWGRGRGQEQQVQQVPPAQVQPRFIQQQPPPAQPRFVPQPELPRAVREQAQAQHEQQRLQREAERNARAQQSEAARLQQQQQQQQEVARRVAETVFRQQPQPQPQPLQGRQGPAEQPQQHQRVQPAQAQNDSRGDSRNQRDDDERPARGRWRN